MIIAIPYVPNRTDFSKLAKAIEKQGANDHHILLVTSQSGEECSHQAASFFERVKPFFRRAFLVLLPPIDPANGYTLANTHFLVASRWAADFQPEAGEIANPPVMYLDPAQHPAESDWADKAQATYLKSGGRVFGYTEPVEDVTLENGFVLEGGKIFSGSVIFDQKFASVSELLSYLRPEESWRVTLRWEMLRSHSHTSYFNDNFSSTAPSAAPQHQETNQEPEQQTLETKAESVPSSRNGVRRIQLD